METIKNDPIIRAVVVIILGVLSFGFAFNLMFGARNGGIGMIGEGGGMGTGGYSFEGILSYTLGFTLKLLVVALVVTVIITFIKFLTKLISGEENRMSHFKNDSLVRTLVVLGGTVLVLMFVLPMFGGMFGTGHGGYGMGYGTMGNGYGGYGMMSNNYGGTGFGISGILEGLLKILLYLSVIGVVIGFVMFFIQNYSKKITEGVKSFNLGFPSSTECNVCHAQVIGQVKFCPECGAKTESNCADCGAHLKSEWKCCPTCGAARVKATQKEQITLSKEV